MAKEKNLFDQLDEISGKQDLILEKLDKVSNIEAQNAQKEAEINRLKNEINGIKSQTQTINNKPKQQANPLTIFIREAKKYWRWFGSSKEFKTAKVLSSVALILLLITGLLCTVISIKCFKNYGTFTFFENVWLIFAIIQLVHAFKTKYIYDINDLALNSSTRYVNTPTNMLVPAKTKKVYTVFMWFALVSVPCNIICIWTIGKEIKGLATVVEIIFLLAMLFAIFTYRYLFVNYNIAWIAGHNLTTKEKVTLVLMPGSKEFVTKEEFEKKFVGFNE